MTKLLWQTEAKKRWLLDDGREVDVFNDYDHCLKCGRPLKNSFSRLVGRGHQCRFDPYSSCNVIMLAITPSNKACSGLAPESAQDDSVGSGASH